MVAIFQFFHNGQCQYSIYVDTRKTWDPNFGGSVISNFSIQCIFTKWWPFFDFFIMADANILFPKCKFSVGLVSPSPHHFILGSVSTFKNDDVSTLKTFIHGHSWVMTFMHLKVHNDWCKFSVGWVFQISHLNLGKNLSFVACKKNLT